MATQSVPTWSTTAATNSTADPTINAAEGMAPSALNDAIRAVMASMAKYRDDISGSTAGLTTGGSSTAYTVTTNATFVSASAMSGCIFTIIPHATSGAAPTLAVDGLTARAINHSTGVAVATGGLKIGTPYLLKYIHASTEFIVMGGVSTIPAGSINAYAGATAPTGWLLCDGSSLVRATYPDLFTAISTTFGAADGSHFSLPDLRGRAIFGKDNMGGSAASRVTTAGSSIDGTTLGASGGGQTATISQANLPAVNFVNSGIAVAAPSISGSTLAQQLTGQNSVVLSAQGPNATFTATTQGAVTQGVSASGGSGTAVIIMDPAIILNYIIKT